MAAGGDASTTLSISNFLRYPTLTTEEGETFVTCRLEAPCFEPVSRPNVDIVAVIDVSGSMAGTKLTMVKETLDFVVKNLKEGDRLGLVTFDSNVKTRFGLRTLTTSNREAAEKDIQQLRAGSCTNLSGGLFEAIKLMQGRKEKASVSSILLMTDGLANEGLRDAHSLTRTMQGMIGEKNDFSVYTFGYGGDHDADMLKQISEIGRGMYYYIESNDLIPESFGDCLGGLLSVFAQNVEVKLRALEDGAAIEQVCMTKKSTLSADKREATFAIGDIQSEEKKDILFRLRLPSPASASTKTYFTASVTYVNLAIKGFDTQEAAVTIRRVAPAELEGREEDPVVRDAVYRFQATEAMEAARKQAEAGNLEDARASVQRVIKTMSADIAEASVQELDQDLNDCLSALSSSHAYQQKGRYELASHAQCYSEMRSNRVWGDEPVRARFAPKKKMAMRGLAKKQ